jgi:hypothetical protein
MFLEMVKDMPRGRRESLGRLLVPLLAVMAVGLGLVAVSMADDARVGEQLREQVQEQAEAAGVLFMDDRLVVPRSGERQVPVLVDGRVAEGLIEVDGAEATLLVRSADGEFVPAAPGS